MPKKAETHVGAVGKINSGKEVAKGYLSPSNVTSADVEAAYEFTKPLLLKNNSRQPKRCICRQTIKELSAEAQAREAASFDARTPLANIEKALSDLSERIDNISTAAPEATIRKSSDMSKVEIPSTEELNSMSWDDVHRLAGSVWN